MPQGPNMNQLLKQAQQMQAEMAKAQEQLKNETVEASAGGGMVKVTMTGDMGSFAPDQDRSRGDRSGGRRDAPGHGRRGRQ